MSKKGKKIYDDDDGRTIADMNVESIRGYEKPEHVKKRSEIQKLNLTKAERRAIFWGSFRAMIPILFFILVGFGIATLIVCWWLGVFR